MFKKVSYLNNIKSFTVRNDQIYYLNTKEEFYLNDKIIANGYGIEKNEYAVFLYENMTDVETSIIFNNGEIKKTKYLLDLSSFNGINTIIYNKNYNDQEKQIGLHNIISQEIKWFYNIERFGFNIRANNNLYYKQTQTCLKSLSLLTGEYDWEVDLGLDGLEVVNILGVEASNLIVLCRNEQKQFEILSLSVSSGKEIWRKNMQVGNGNFIFSEDKTSLIYLYSGGLWFNGVQVTRGNNIFREINTKDGSVRREGVLWQLDEAGLGIHNCTLHEGFIYFTAVYKSFGATVLGVLDYETLSLLWWEEVKMDEADGFGNFFLNQPLQVAGNKIYVLDKTHVLHIYQRDESVPFVKPTESGLRTFEDLPASPENNLPTQDTEYQDFSDLPF